MKEQLDLLVRLQEIDTQIGQSKEKKNLHPIQLQEAEIPLQSARMALDRATAHLESVSSTKKAKEGDLQAKEDGITKLKSRQTEIKTNKEYQALLQELSMAQKNKDQLEEDLLLLMDEMDNQKKEVLSHQNEVDEATRRFKATQEALARESTRLDQSFGELETRRSMLIQTLDPKLLNTYEKLRSTKNDLAVVPVDHGSCAGCHMNLPPQLVAEVKKVEEILTCSNCHRILYWPFVPNGEDSRIVGAKPIASDSGNA